MVWNKLKKQLESFLSPSLVGKVEYLASGYRYTPDKPARAFIVVDKQEVFNINDPSTGIRWYQTEQEVKSDPDIRLSVSNEDIDAVRKKSGDKVPEDRLAVIALNTKTTTYARMLLSAQATLLKTDFEKTALHFLSESIENCLESDDVILNILALMDRRVGKKRLVNMEKAMQMKHPIVQYFYWLRRRG